MNGMKQMLHQQLIANVIKDRCANAPGIIFDESLCSQHRCIRFRSERLAAKSISATYEVFIYSDRLEICLGSESWELRGNIPQALLEQFDDFLKAGLYNNGRGYVIMGKIFAYYTQISNLITLISSFVFLFTVSYITYRDCRRK